MAEYSPIDYGATFANVANALPDYAAEAYNSRMARTQQGTLALNQAKDQREVDETDAAAADWAALEEHPTAAGWVGFIMRHPKLAEEAKAAQGIQDKETEKADATLSGRIFTAAGNGEWDMADQLYADRIAADEAAGQDVRYDKSVQAMIRSGDPVQRNKAITIMGLGLALKDPAHFATTYATLFPDAQLEWHENAWWDKRTGQPVSQSFYGQNITTPVGTKQLGRMPGVPVAGYGNVTPEGTTVAPPSGPNLAPVLNPNAPSIYAAGGPMAPTGVVPPVTPGIAAQPGDMNQAAIPGVTPAPADILGAPFDFLNPNAGQAAPPDPLAAAPEETPAAPAQPTFAAGPSAAAAPAPPQAQAAALNPAAPNRPQPPPRLRNMALARDVRNYLVGNAKAAVEQIFPGARVTEWQRDPKSKLGRANPNSWHNHSRAAVDVAPIPGLSFGGFIDRIKGEGYKILESRDEVKNPAKHATGPHWHTVLQLYPARSAQEYGKIPVGGRYLAPDGTERRKGQG